MQRDWKNFQYNLILNRQIRWVILPSPSSQWSSALSHGAGWYFSQNHFWLLSGSGPSPGTQPCVQQPVKEKDCGVDVQCAHTANMHLVEMRRIKLGDSLFSDLKPSPLIVLWIRQVWVCNNWIQQVWVCNNWIRQVWVCNNVPFWCRAPQSYKSLMHLAE